MLQDDTKEALNRQLSSCAEALDNGTFFGSLRIDCVVYAKRRRGWTCCCEFQKVFAMFSAVMQLETYNSLNAFFATIPGSHKLNRRRQLITTSNYADYSFLYTLDTGEVFNKHLGKEYLASLKQITRRPITSTCIRKT